jgi:hypothetical protein
MEVASFFATRLLAGGKKDITDSPAPLFLRGNALKYANIIFTSKHYNLLVFHNF